MKIGIIGLGVVGEACKKGFEKNGYEVLVHDIKFKTKVSDVLDTDVYQFPLHHIKVVSVIPV